MKFYNKTRGPLSISLGGKSLAIPAKTWVDINSNDCGSESLQKALLRGDLIRGKEDKIEEKPIVVVAEVPVTGADSPTEAASEPSLEPETDEVPFKRKRK